MKMSVVICFVLCIVVSNAFATGSLSEPSESPMTQRMMLLVIQLGLVILVARIAGILFEKLSLPVAVGELAAGILIGPYALGGIGFYGFPDGLFPLPGDGGLAVSPELYGLSVVAAVVLLFNIGLETELRLLLRFAVAGGLVGLGGLVVSFLLGLASAKFLLASLFGQDVTFLSPPCLILGVIASATSVGVTARILSDKRKADSPEGVTILSAAVIDDVLGIILLAIVMGGVTASRRGGGGIDWAHIAVVASKAIGVWLGATIIGLVASRKISFLLKWFGERTSIAVMALSLALILSGLFEEAGLAMIIGAYVAGLSLSKADIAHVIRERLSAVSSLLIPLFFCVTGMQIDLSALATGPVLIFGLVYAAASFVGKIAGCGLAGLAANFNLRGAGRIGFGMAPRCEVALVIAAVGVSGGILGREMLAAVIIMVVLNMLLAPAGLVFLYRSNAPGTRRPIERNSGEQTVSFDFPSIEMTGFFVLKLVPVFESEGFFVHLINRSRNIYQLRKDDMVIEFRHAGNTLTFSAQPAAIPLVNGAVYEALASLEKAVKALKAPLDSKSMRAGIQTDSGPLGSQFLQLSDYLTPGLIEPDLRGETKSEIIDELLGLLVRNGLVNDRRAARKAIWEREESMSTGLQYGVAIPHGKTDAVDGLVCSVGLKKDGIDFDAMDGAPSRIFVLTLSPKSRPAPHVQFMSTISRLLDSEGRERILSCETAREVYEALTVPPDEL